MIRVSMVSLALIPLLVFSPRHARAQAPISALASLIDALAADSTTGLRRHTRDSTLVNFKDLTLEPSEETPESLPPAVGVRVRHNWYLDCGATDSRGSRVARAHCAFREFAHYIDIVDFAPRGGIEMNSGAPSPRGSCASGTLPVGCSTFRPTTSSPWSTQRVGSRISQTSRLPWLKPSSIRRRTTSSAVRGPSRLPSNLPLVATRESCCVSVMFAPGYPCGLWVRSMNRTYGGATDGASGESPMLSAVRPWVFSPTCRSAAELRR